MGTKKNRPPIPGSQVPRSSGPFQDILLQGHVGCTANSHLGTARALRYQSLMDSIQNPMNIPWTSRRTVHIKMVEKYRIPMHKIPGTFHLHLAFSQMSHEKYPYPISWNTSCFFPQNLGALSHDYSYLILINYPYWTIGGLPLVILTIIIHYPILLPLYIILPCPLSHYYPIITWNSSMSL